ncbi:MAG: glucose dehydrogenase [Actinobacteria bacterium]|nr:glucose dehydrogenase [Actinomycetota bacterium]
MAVTGSHCRLVRVAVVLALALALFGCSDEESPTPNTAPETQPESPDPQPTERESEGSRPQSFEPRNVNLDLETVAEGFDAPLGVTHADDGSGRLFVVEQTGAIRILDDGRVLDEPFLDVGESIVAGGEQGLLGLAFHPGFRRNGRFFINFTDVNGNTVVAEVQTSNDPDVADAGSVTPLLQIDQPFANHNGGQLAFGPDGYLYIATGDGGSAGDPQGNGQNTEALLGKLLRLDVDSGDPYGIPGDNPFASGGGAPEVWAYGLRNPWRFSFDSQTDGLWIADVGQGDFEEINKSRPDRGGLNYGWNVMEGTDCFGGGDCDRSDTVLPISGYTHDAGCSVTGGYVYRGSEFPVLTGGYVFGDYCSGTIWGIDARAGSFTEPVELMQSGLSISSFGLDEGGELYLTDLDGGRVLQVVAR